MIGLQAIFTGLLRVVLAALLMMTGVTSAAAEASCTVAAITTPEGPKTDDPRQAVAVKDPIPEEERETPSSSPFHCAFSHACHGVTAPAAPAVQPKRLTEAADYVVTAFSALSTTEPANAERPPQA